MSRRTFTRACAYLAALCTAIAATAAHADAVRFTVTGNPSNASGAFSDTLSGISQNIFDTPIFHAMLGQAPSDPDGYNTAYTTAFAGVPLHDVLAGSSTAPLRDSWNGGGAHFASVLQYWDENGTTAAEMRSWLSNDLSTSRAASHYAPIIVFGREPTTADDAARAAFLQVLQDNGVTAYITAGSGVYSYSQPFGAGLYQVDVGNSGLGPASDGQSFLEVVLYGDAIDFTAYRSNSELGRWKPSFQHSFSISAVPLPPAAFAGLALLGGLGAVRTLRRR